MKEKSKLLLEYFGYSDIGTSRLENQDTFSNYPDDTNDIYSPLGVIFIIADGMGGHEKGKEASRIAVDEVISEYSSCSSNNIPECLQNAFNMANKRVFNYSQQSLISQPMGTTCTALVIKSEMAFIAHIGDSRIHKISNKNIEQITTDHTAVNEMYNKGLLSKSEAKNHPDKSLLVRAIGIEKQIDIDIIKDIRIKSGDHFVLCSDGLSPLHKNEIKDIVLENSPEDACKLLVKSAKERGSTDNITVQIVKINNYEATQSNISKSHKEKSVSKWLGFSVLAIFLLMIAIYLLFSGDSEKREIEAEQERILLNSIQIEGSEQNLSIKDQYDFNIAEELFINGYLDSALTIYLGLLKNRPTQLNILNKIYLIHNKYVNKGNQLLQKEDYSGALNFYKKANQIKPDDEELLNLIKFCEERNESGSIKNTYDNSQVNSDSLILYDKIVNSAPLLAESTDSIYNPSHWRHEYLSNADYIFTSNSIILSETHSKKKLVYNKESRDVEIEVELKLKDSNRNGKAGVIVGYNNAENNKNESFFLITLNQENILSFYRYSNSSVEQLFATKTSDNESIQKNTLKIKTLGSWIMIYFNEKLQKAWLGEKPIRGKLGVFADPEIYAKFTNIKVSPSIM
jgi:protein phosphatase